MERFMAMIVYALLDLAVRVVEFLGYGKASYLSRNPEND